MSLLDFTRIVNYVVLALSLWLGLYVVARNHRRLIAWLTGLTLWSVASLSLSTLLAFDPPPEATQLPVWVQFFWPIWQEERVERAVSGWLNGWSITPAIVLWHHITILMRPGPLDRWRWMRIIVAYVLLLAAILIQAYTSDLFIIVDSDPLYMPTLEPGPLYGLFLFISLLFVGLCLVNLIRSAKNALTAMTRKQFVILALATVVAGLTGPFSIAGSLFNLRVPIVILSLLLGFAVLLIGFGVASYGALVVGRTVRRDFIYNGITVAGVTALYLSVTWFSVVAYQVPGAAFVFVFMLAIITHSLVDVARRALDSIFFRQDTRQLRANLQRLTTIAGEHNNLDEELALTLNTLCTSIRATFGLIILFEGNELRLAAHYRWPRTKLPLSQTDLTADDILTLEPGTFPAPLTEAALLIPLYVDTRQLGVLLLGQPVNGVHYSRNDIELLLNPSDRIADAIWAAEREADYLKQVAQLVAEREEQTPQIIEVEEISVKDVEKAFRRLTDFAYLGQSPLVQLKLVSTKLPAAVVTHVDRGKGVYSVLIEALDKLRPDDEIPESAPGREWYPYLILHRAYLDDIPNRDIMQNLYISEGTFNRTRRAALRAVTRSLTEMEAAVVQVISEHQGNQN